MSRRPIRWDEAFAGWISSLLLRLSVETPILLHFQRFARKKAAKTCWGTLAVAGGQLASFANLTTL